MAVAAWVQLSATWRLPPEAVRPEGVAGAVEATGLGSLLSIWKPAILRRWVESPRLVARNDAESGPERPVKRT